MFLEEAAELFPEDMCEDEIEDLLADPWLEVIEVPGGRGSTAKKINVLTVD